MTPESFPPPPLPLATADLLRNWHRSPSSRYSMATSRGGRGAEGEASSSSSSSGYDIPRTRDRFGSSRTDSRRTSRTNSSLEN